METKKIYRELNNGKELEISVSYDNGKDYPYNPKGIYARMTELTRTPFKSAAGGYLVTWSSGDPYQKVLLEKVTRGSQKRVNAWATEFEAIADDMVEKWNNGEYKCAATMIFEAVPATF